MPSQLVHLRHRARRSLSPVLCPAAYPASWWLGVFCVTVGFSGMALLAGYTSRLPPFLAIGLLSTKGRILESADKAEGRRDEAARHLRLKRLLERKLFPIHHKGGRLARIAVVHAFPVTPTHYTDFAHQEDPDSSGMYMKFRKKISASRLLCRRYGVRFPEKRY